jgi:hypothetical protein
MTPDDQKTAERLVASWIRLMDVGCSTEARSLLTTMIASELQRQRGRVYDAIAGNPDDAILDAAVAGIRAVEAAMRKPAPVLRLGPGGEYTRVWP